MKNYFSTKIRDNLYIAFLLLMIVPFLIICFFNHPSADDWGLAENIKMRGFFEVQQHYYKNWTGKFFSNALLSFNPLYFNSITGYKAVTLILMITFIMILYLLISKLTCESINKKEKVLITLSVIFLYFYSMPSLSQSFYWMTASVVYQCGLILIMLFIINYLKINSTESKIKKNILVIISALILFAVSGCSEMSMVTGVLMISIISVSEIIKNRKINMTMIIYILSCAAGSFILLTAPGNKVRGSLYPDSHKIFPSLITTIQTLAEYFIQWIMYSPIIFVTILLIPIFAVIIEKYKSVMKGRAFKPVIVILIFLSVLFILFFTPVWSLGRSPFSRTVNIIYFVFITGWFYITVVMLNFISEKKYYNRIINYPAIVSIILIIITSLFLLKKNNVKAVYSDILRGNANQYDKELNARYDFLFKSDKDTIVLPELRFKPRTIFFTDITGNPDTEFNKMYAHYFNKKSVAVVKKDSTDSD